jgi:arylsulfatase A-like enzyme
MRRRQFLTVCGVGAAAAAGGIAWWAMRDRRTDTRPNVVLIVADDLGWGDVGYHNESKDVRTPHIDSIANDGVAFTAGYVSAPVCSPSRAGLLTGKYQQRFGFEFNVGKMGDKSKPEGMPLEERILPEVLKAAGYATGMVGKWHMGSVRDLAPNARGFDRFFGFRLGSRSYWGRYKKVPVTLYSDDERVEESEYLTDAFAREACAFVEKNRNRPFFLYMPFNAVHHPLEAPPAKYVERFADVADAPRRNLLSILSAMDDAVGAVLAKLKELKLDDNTLVIFTSDNGGTRGAGTSKNGPFRAGKGSVHEGGVRVPFCMRWPGKFPVGRKLDGMVSTLDVVPTVLAMMGVAAPGPLDGKDLLPYAGGTTQQPTHDRLFWRYGEIRGARVGNWKWSESKEHSGGLFDLSVDPSERNDRSASHPAKVAELKAAWEAWAAEMRPPAWPQPSVYDGEGREDGEDADGAAG